MNNKKNSGKGRIWSTKFVFVLLATFACNITMTMMMPIMPMYLAKLGQPQSLAGVVVGIFTFASLLSRPLWGRFLDSCSGKSVLLIGLVLIVFVSVLYRFAGGIIPLLALRITHGIGYSAATNGTGTIAADLVPPARRSEGLGYFGVVFAASLALGPALSIQIVHISDIFTCFLTAACIGVGGLIFALSMQNGQSVEEGTASRHKTEVSGKSILEKGAISAGIVMLFVAFNYSAVMTFVPSYSISLGLGGLSLFFLVYALALLVCRIFIGKYTDRKGYFGVLIPGNVLMAASFLFLAFAETKTFFIIAAVLFGAGYGTVQPNLNAIVISGCAPSRRGAANATFFASMDLGIGLGAMVWGLVSGAFGYSSIYLAGLAFFLAAGILGFILKKGAAFGNPYTISKEESL